MSSTRSTGIGGAPARGATTPSRAWWVIGGLLIAILVGALGWWTLRNESARVTATTIGYKVVDATQVTVSFDVSRPPEQPVTCTVQAIDGHFGVVGRADVVIPTGGERTTHHEASVRTTTRAVTGVVQDCVRT